MNTVHKYQLMMGSPPVMMPRGAEVLHVAEQHGGLHLWARVDDAAPLVQRQFYAVGTGHPMPAGELVHVGSVLIDGGVYVFHIFEAL